MTKSQTILDEKRSTPFHHSLFCLLSWLWPFSLIPPFIVAAKTGNLVLGLCIAFAVNSLLTVLFYREDKYLAQYKYWRIPEKVLHLWEFFCGWPGALYAQHAFRHKRSKTSFMLVFWLCTIANATLVFLLFYHFDLAEAGKMLKEWWQTLLH